MNPPLTIPLPCSVVDLGQAWEPLRPHLLRVGYRVTGSLADAEDAVQDAWLRLARLPAREREAIRDLRAWATTVVGRLCLDRLRSAAACRERYVGPWLPEPVVTSLDGSPDPLAEVVRDEEVRMAAMVVLDALTPEQRVAFVLHDAFDVPFAEIATLLGCSEAAARQHASRARRAAARAPAPARAAAAEQRRLLGELTAALHAGDPAAVARLLHPDAVLVTDGGGRVRAARRPVRGAAKVARLLAGLRARYGADLLAEVRPVLVNGDPGLLVPGEGRELTTSVTVLSVVEGRVARIYQVANPDKLTRLPVA